MIEPIYNYLVYGYSPGGFFESMFANDFMTAMRRSHPANSLEEMKNISGWILNCCPTEAWGSYDKVRAWPRIDSKDRRQLLEDWKLVYTEQDEIMMALKGRPAIEPILF